jgi:hypothetical protein
VTWSATGAARQPSEPTASSHRYTADAASPTRTPRPYEPEAARLNGATGNRTARHCGSNTASSSEHEQAGRARKRPTTAAGVRPVTARHCGCETASLSKNRVGRAVDSPSTSPAPGRFFVFATGARSRATAPRSRRAPAYDGPACPAPWRGRHPRVVGVALPAREECPHWRRSEPGGGVQRVPRSDRRQAFQTELDVPIVTGTGCGSSQGGEVHPLDVVILLPYNAIEISCGPSRRRQVRFNLDRYRRCPGSPASRRLDLIVIRQIPRDSRGLPVHTNLRRAASMGRPLNRTARRCGSNTASSSEHEQAGRARERPTAKRPPGP